MNVNNHANRGVGILPQNGRVVSLKSSHASMMGVKGTPGQQEGVVNRPLWSSTVMQNKKELL